jgi:hypothetical protein
MLSLPGCYNNGERSERSMKYLLVLLLVFCAVPVIAQVPSGQFTYTFTTLPLWDVTGTYTITSTDGSGTAIVDIQHEANGQIIGARTTTYDNGVDSAEGRGPESGRIFHKNGTVGWRSSSIGVLTGVSGGIPITIKYKAKGTVTVVPSSLQVVSSTSVTLCLVGGKCETLTEGNAGSLPDGMTGDWTLDTDIVSAGNKLTGTGTITLSNGRELIYGITGSYSSKNQLSKLKLVGEGDAIGTGLSLTTQGTGMDLTALKGKVLGQTPTFP